MKCEDIQLKLLELDDEKLPGDIKAHLDQCVQCGNFLFASRRFMETRLIEPPPAYLDRAVMELARNRGTQTGTEQSKLIFFPRVAWLAAAAAVIAVCCLTAVHYLKNNAKEEAYVAEYITEGPKDLSGSIAEIDMGLIYMEEAADIEKTAKGTMAADAFSWDNYFYISLMELEGDICIKEQLLSGEELLLKGEDVGLPNSREAGGIILKQV